MTTPAGWYAAGDPGKLRWWDGVQWTAHERDASVAQPSPVTPTAPAMGWYPVPGSEDVRWWDGTGWAPYRIRDGRPKADPVAVEPAAMGFVLGILFIVMGGFQLIGALVTDLSTFLLPPVLFVCSGAILLVGAIHTRGLRGKPSPTAAPVVDDSARPLPHEVEGPGAGWYPMTRQVTRWWTGTRWSWYIGSSFGARPGYAGPRGYRISLVMGWVLAGVAAVAVIGGIVMSVAFSSSSASLVPVILGIVLGVIFGLLALFVLLLTKARRYSLILPTTPPPVR